MVTKERSNERGRWYLLMPQEREEVLTTKDQYLAGAEIAARIKQQQLKLGEDEGMAAQIDQIPF
jgi:hypothetical protein